jgi:hypothetical protein
VHHEIIVAKERGWRHGALVLVASGLNLLVVAPAFAACATDSGWQVTGKSDAWMLTSLYSKWVAGPATIQLTESGSATRSTVQDVNIGVSVSYILASASAKYHVSWSATTSTSSAWAYTISVAAGKMARAAEYKRGSRLSVQQWHALTNCTDSWGPVYYQYSPYTATDNSQYCITRDPSPGTQYVFSSSCGH